MGVSNSEEVCRLVVDLSRVERRNSTSRLFRIMQSYVNEKKVSKAVLELLCRLLAMITSRDQLDCFQQESCHLPHKSIEGMFIHI